MPEVLEIPSGQALAGIIDQGIGESHEEPIAVCRAVFSGLLEFYNAGADDPVAQTKSLLDQTTGVYTCHVVDFGDVRHQIGGISYRAPVSKSTVRFKNKHRLLKPD